MGRHTMLNPNTGRTVFKTGKLGQKLQKKNASKAMKGRLSGANVGKSAFCYNGLVHILAVRANGAPYYKTIQVKKPQQFKKPQQVKKTVQKVKKAPVKRKPVKKPPTKKKTACNARS